MTFVLACAIAVVFLVALVKLWRTSRQMRRQEVLDEEKRARLAEIRKVEMASSTGLTVHGGRKKRAIEIPFGVRAIQTGIEVDGIWISQPTTPSRSSTNSKTGLGVPWLDEENANETIKDNEKSLSSRPARGQNSSQQSHSLRPISSSVPETHFPSASAARMLAATVERTTPTRVPFQQRESLDDLLRRLGGAFAQTGHHDTANSTPQLYTYIPSSQMANPSSSSIQRQSIYPTITSSSMRHSRTALYQPRVSSASADSLTSFGGRLSSRSNHSTSSRSSTLSRARQTYMGIQPPTQDPSPNGSEQLEANDPIYSISSTLAAAPIPHALPGHAIANRTTRKVNPAFEVLPAGTFSCGQARTDTSNTDEEEAEMRSESRRASGVRNKLRRASQLNPRWGA
ncbi:hypothetical protein SEPCBS57363_004848 [Sporothrix epigloea]|uniref:Uncharacterized protein n=1 Tax=Sporothrix epigloea TaxID=1892477 RepID=A0ABP0DUA6_9PEZI